MKKKITIIDYGAGNILSLKRALEYLSFKAEVASDSISTNNANYLILPGDGAFGYAVKKLKEKKIYESIINHVYNKKPFLGICIGMQLLFTESNEFGNHKGLNFIKGKIIKISTKNHTAKIPAIGWSKIKLEVGKKMIKKINLNSFDNKSFYFDSIKSLKDIIFTINSNQLIQCKKAMFNIAKKEYNWKKVSKEYSNIF